MKRMGRTSSNPNLLKVGKEVHQKSLTVEMTHITEEVGDRHLIFRHL